MDFSKTANQAIRPNDLTPGQVTQQNIALISLVAIGGWVVAWLQPDVRAMVEQVIGASARSWLLVAILGYLAAGVAGRIRKPLTSAWFGRSARSVIVLAAGFALLDGAAMPLRIVGEVLGTVLAIVGGIGGQTLVGAFVIVAVLAVLAIMVFGLVEQTNQGVPTRFARALAGRLGRRVGPIDRVDVIAAVISGVLVAAWKTAKVLGALGVILATFTFAWVEQGSALLGFGSWFAVNEAGPSAEQSSHADPRRPGVGRGVDTFLAGLSGYLGGMFRGRPNYVTDEGQPIYVDPKAGWISAAWQEKVVGPDGRPTRETRLRSVGFQPQVNDLPNRLLAQLARAIPETIITDSVRHGNTGGGRMFAQPDDDDDERGGPAAGVPVGTRVLIKRAAVRGVRPGIPLPPEGVTLGLVLDTWPAVTNNILTRINPDNLAENLARLTNYSPAQIRDRVTIHDEDLQDDPAFGGIPGIYISFRLGGTRPAARPTVDDDDDGLPW